MSEPRRLALLRHAKSSWADADCPDHQRPLDQRGQRAATRVGERLREEGVVPDVVLCSSALRTRQTLERLELPPGAQVRFEDALYGAGADELFERLRRLGDASRSILVIGHNPGMHELALALTDDPRLTDFPTCALADLRLPIEAWRDLQAGSATLHRFVVPRDLP